MNKEEAEAILTEVCDKTKVSPWDVYKDWATISLDELLAFANACEKIGMEKAAKICDCIQLKTDKWGPMATYCAEAIRKSI